MFHWMDYTEHYSLVVNSWLDKDAVELTGIDDGWDHYWLAVKKDALNYSGCRDFCKVIFEESVPVAAICFGTFQNTMTVSEILVAPTLRGQGIGTRLLTELIEMARKSDFGEVDQITAVIFPQNAASQKAFQKAGFVLSGKTEDGIDFIYTHLL